MRGKVDKIHSFALEKGKNTANRIVFYTPEQLVDFIDNWKRKFFTAAKNYAFWHENGNEISEDEILEILNSEEINEASDDEDEQTVYQW